MLDGVDPGADRGLDASAAMRVCRDLEAPLMRLIGNRAQLLFGELLLTRLGVARENPAGGADLDHLCAVLALLAHLLAQLGGAIADRRRLRAKRGRKIGLVAMPAGRADRVRGRHDARAGRPALGNRLLQCHVVIAFGTDVAHRGEPGIEHCARVRGGNEAPEAVGELQAVVPAISGRAVEMDVHVDQPGEQCLARQVDMRDVRAPAHRARIGDRRNALVLGEDRGEFGGSAGGDVDHPCSGDHRAVGCLLRCLLGRGRNRERGRGERRRDQTCKTFHDVPLTGYPG